MVLGKIRNQRGAGAIGCLFMTILTAAALYAGYQFGIPRLRHSSFEERINESISGFRQQQPAEVQKQIIQIGTDFDIALTPAQVQVVSAGGRLMIDVKYEKVVDLKVWQKTVYFVVSRKSAP